MPHVLNFHKISGYLISGGAPGKAKYYHDEDGNLTMMSLAGDMNCDGVVNFADLSLFTQAIKYFAGTETWPFTCPALNGDLNGDGTVTTADQSMFIAAITAGWTGPATAYDWDAENRLVTVRPIEGTEAAGTSRVDFVYDSSWRRVRKTVTPWDEQASGWAGTPSLDRKYLWSGWRLLLETDVLASGGGAVLRSFTWGLDLAGLGGVVNSLESAGTIGGLLAVRKYDVTGGPSPADPVDHVYLYDANGNVGQVVDWSQPAGQASAAIVGHYEYDPYGGVTKAEGAYASENTWRFSTKQWDDETGLGYWGYRYYEPVFGRWMSRDPIEERGGLLLYTFVSNRPVGGIDALGLIDSVTMSAPKIVLTSSTIAEGAGLLGIAPEVALGLTFAYLLAEQIRRAAEVRDITLRRIPPAPCNCPCAARYWPTTLGSWMLLVTPGKDWKTSTFINHLAAALHQQQFGTAAHIAVLNAARSQIGEPPLTRADHYTETLGYCNGLRNGYQALAKCLRNNFNCSTQWGTQWEPLWQVTQDAARICQQLRRKAPGP
ncbi:MAG: hypothetical protein IPM18_01760 [Phycisphaerales bacterium]|nr:hypothetical protein [Phycisphaerales bacterium]